MENALLYSYETLDCILTYNVSAINKSNWDRVKGILGNISFTLMMNLGGKNAKEANV